MELKEFISQTIIQLADGLREGHKYIQDNNFGEGVSDDKYKEINFDIAVTSNEESTTGVGGKISVANVFSAGVKDEATTKLSNVSRIQFKTYLNKIAQFVTCYQTKNLPAPDLLVFIGDYQPRKHNG